MLPEGKSFSVCGCEKGYFSVLAHQIPRWKLDRKGGNKTELKLENFEDVLFDLQTLFYSNLLSLFAQESRDKQISFCSKHSMIQVTYKTNVKAYSGVTL